MRAQDLDPLSPVINQTLADALFQSGKENLAIQMLQKQIAFDSGFAGAHEALGNCMVWQGRPSEAIPELEKAHQLYGNTSGWGFCGFAYARAGRTADARNLLDQLLRLEEQGKSVTMEVALVYHGLGDDATTPGLLIIWKRPPKIARSASGN